MAMTPCFIFVPGLSEKYRSGGLIVIRDVASMLAESGEYDVHFVTTHETHPDSLAPEKAFSLISDAAFRNKNPLCIVTWGPLVEKHIKMIRKEVPGCRIVYYAQSFGWNIRVPRDGAIPIICVSRYVMAQWALHAPENYCAYIPPLLHEVFKTGDEKRSIDVLVHERKQNEYCLRTLVPLLKKEGLHVEIIKKWIDQEEFAQKLRQTKIFLYATELHKAGWRRRLPGEGFGMPALEAIASGCIVASNMLGGVSDFLTPGENCIKVQNGNPRFDVAQIKEAVSLFSAEYFAAEKIKNIYSRPKIQKTWLRLLKNLINQHKVY